MGKLYLDKHFKEMVMKKTEDEDRRWKTEDGR
jgi:hypothetical protein